VSGWDDPRMPTLAGLRRRGYTPESIRDLRAHRRGQGRQHESSWRCSSTASVKISTPRRAPHGRAAPAEARHHELPEGKVEELQAVNNPERSVRGHPQVPFSRELWIEQDDFKEVAPKKYFRLNARAEVRACVTPTSSSAPTSRWPRRPGGRGALTYDPATVGGDSGGRNVKGTIHWCRSGPKRRRGGGAPVRDLFATPKARRRRGLQGALNRTR